VLAFSSTNTGRAEVDWADCADGLRSTARADRKETVQIFAAAREFPAQSR
jgi:hypothetical protein